MLTHDMTRHAVPWSPLALALVLAACASSNNGSESPSGSGGVGAVGGTTASGGTTSGGTASGGTTSGGTASGGTASGGTASGGTASGGALTSNCADPVDLGVHIVGRHDGCDPSGVRMSWSGTGFVARFTGTGLSATLDDSENHWTVVVDGTVQDTLVASNGVETYALAEGLTAGEHTVEMYRQTEASFGATVVQGVDVSDGELLEPAVPARRIEIVGDSITCGYGNEGADTSCSFSAETENHYLTYGALLARRFNAELSTVAWSGKGVVSNYNGNLDNPLPSLYGRAVPGDAESVWTFAWQPDLVIINLGTNDYSTDNDPTDDDFINGYEALLTTMRERYPNATILCTVGPLLQPADMQIARANIAAAVARRSDAGDSAVLVHEMTTPNDSPGCDWHPSLATHAAMADELAAPITSALGW